MPDAARTIAADVLDRLAEDLEVLLADVRSLRAALAGQAAPAPAPAPAPSPAPSAPPVQTRAAQLPRVLVPRAPAGVAEAASAAEVIRRYMEAPFTGHLFTTATDPITPTGASYDLRHPVDFVMVMPTVDAYIDFDISVNPQVTPPVFAGTLFAWNMRVQRIYYQSVNVSTTGKLYVWAAWW